MILALVITLGVMVALLATCALARGRRQLREHVPPRYRVLASDLGHGGRPVTLRDDEWGLTGRIDLLLERRGTREVVPVEYKTAWKGYEPGTVRRTHRLQLGAYFLICEGDSRIKRTPATGLLRYIDEAGHLVSGGEVRIANTARLRAEVVEAVQAVRRALVADHEIHRTHNTAYNCRHCSVRGQCVEALR